MQSSVLVEQVRHTTSSWLWISVFCRSMKLWPMRLRGWGKGGSGKASHVRVSISPVWEGVKHEGRHATYVHRWPGPGCWWFQACFVFYPTRGDDPILQKKLKHGLKPRQSGYVSIVMISLISAVYHWCQLFLHRVMGQSLHTHGFQAS